MSILPLVSSENNDFNFVSVPPLFVRRLVEVSPDKFEYHGLTAERRKDGSYLCGSCHFNTKSMNLLRNHLWEKRKTGINPLKK